MTVRFQANKNNVPYGDNVLSELLTVIEFLQINLSHSCDNDMFLLRVVQ